ncbi:MAG: hypothetical protein V4722_05625 [Bacteroidota bacterium]
MADQTAANNTRSPGSLKWYIGIFIGVIILFIIGVAINVCLLNTQFDRNNKIYVSRQVTNPLTNLKADSTKIYKLKEEDLQKFNAHIEYLTDKVESEVKRTQENSQYDLDRINTFLALGIGLLAIIGGLLPIFVNYFSKENLERRMSTFENTCNTIDSKAKEAKAQADSAKQTAEEASANISGFETRVTNLSSDLTTIGTELPALRSGIDELKKATKKVPYIDILGFQNAVAKLTSTDAMKLFVGDERIKWIVGYLENLILSIDNFDDGIHSFEAYTAENLKSFLSVVSELKVALFLGPIRRIPNGRGFQPKIDEVVLNLGKLETLNNTEYKNQLRIVSGMLTGLMQLVKTV